MQNLIDLTVVQLQRAIAIKQRIETLEAQLNLLEGEEAPTPSAAKASAPVRRKYKMTAAHKRKLIKTLAKARAARWAKTNGKGTKASKPVKKRRKMSAAAKSKIAAAARARWAKAKAAGRKSL